MVLAEQNRAVVVADDTGTGRSVLGIDLASGDEVWRYEDVGYPCTWGAPIGCIEDPGTPQAKLVTIEASDGTRSTASYPGAMAMIGAGEDMVVVEATNTFEENVVLMQADGSERWRLTIDAMDGESFAY